MEIKNNPKTDQSFLLVDSTSTLSKINKLKNSCQKIISFDLESDRLLTNNSINHEISENFVTNEELKSIDSACINFCQWYNENNGDRLLSYEGINLGSLFRVEFNNFLIPFLKNFIILVKIVKNFPDVTFLCSSTIYQILSKLVKNVQSLEEKSLESQLVWDKIQYNITDSISLKISKENFQKLKKISEMVTSVFLKDSNGKTDGKSFALIEFDSKKYETLKKVNVEATANIVNIALLQGVQKLCYVSSIATLGNTTDGKSTTEETPFNQNGDNNVYSLTKYAAEMEVWRGTLEGLKAIIINPGVILGAGSWHRGSGAIISLASKAMPYFTGGTIAVVDVQDVVNCMLLLMKSSVKNGPIKSEAPKPLIRNLGSSSL